jgi:hypothetical protein
MCVSIANEAAAHRYVAELVKGGHWKWARQAVAGFQVSQGWLLDYDRVTCERRPPPKPKRPSVQPGMRMIRNALREVVNMPPPVMLKAAV